MYKRGDKMDNLSKLKELLDDNKIENQIEEVQLAITKRFGQMNYAVLNVKSCYQNLTFLIHMF